MKKVIFITGLSYSGSTLLDFLLSYHENILGLGEIDAVLNKKRYSFEKTNEICSCGAEMNKCVFWSKYKKTDDNLTYADKYRKILSLADVNNKNIIVDSSKKIGTLEFLTEMENKGDIKLKVIYLLKDVRSWAVSAEKAAVRWGKISRPYFYYFYSWYSGNKKIKNFLINKKIDFIQIGYEELCFNNELILNKILNFVGVSKNDFSLNNSPSTHIAFGNRMKKDKDKRKKIVYDNRWFRNYWLNLVILFFPRIFLWNKKNVYSNSFSSDRKKGK